MTVLLPLGLSAYIAAIVWGRSGNAIVTLAAGVISLAWTLFLWVAWESWRREP